MNVDKKIYVGQITTLISNINVGSEQELTIKELAETIKEVIDFKGNINFDSSKPDGVQRKLIDSSLIKIFGFNPNTNLKDGLVLAYRDFLKKC